MKIKKILDHVEKSDIDRFTVASDFVKMGYGQTMGGYMTGGGSRPNQREHFISYYKGKETQEPSFANLWCPELMLFISEVLGLNQKYIIDARDYAMAMEDTYNLCEKDKGATYLSFEDEAGENVLAKFKEKLKIYEINNILKGCDDLEEALHRIKNL